MGKTLVTYFSVFFLLLAFIGQPLAAGRMNCTQLPAAATVSEISPPEMSDSQMSHSKMSNMDEHHHLGHQSMASSSGMDYTNKDSTDKNHTDKNHSCCQDSGCAASHCFSTLPFMAFASVNLMSEASTPVIVSYRDTYLSKGSDSLFRPPILG